MTKSQSDIIKGIAILMMIWYHCFADNYPQCIYLLWIHGRPLEFYLHNACYPVPFFLIVTGYGLTFSFRNQALTIKKQWKRILKLYCYYWLVLGIFTTIGHFRNPAVYWGDIWDVLSNITASKCTYNGEIWFLFPYAILCLLSPWLIRFLSSITTTLRFLLVSAAYLIIFLSSKYLVINCGDNICCEFYIQVHYLITTGFYFSLGYLLYQTENGGKSSILSDMPDWAKLLALLVLFAIKACFKITLADGIYAFVFVLLLSRLSWNKLAASIVGNIGRYSMIMWMTHTFWAIYFFHDYFYSLRYPLLIWIAVVFVSYITSFCILSCVRKLRKTS